MFILGDIFFKVEFELPFNFSSSTLLQAISDTCDELQPVIIWLKICYTNKLKSQHNSKDTLYGLSDCSLQCI